MKIIVEGPDGSGKSTLISHLMRQWPSLILIRGEGPEKYKGEMELRATRWINMLDFPQDIVFDRFPHISNQVYAKLRGGMLISDDLVLDFLLKAKKAYIIICRGQPELTQVNKEVDTEDHLRLITENHESICGSYRHLEGIADYVYDYKALSINRHMGNIKQGVEKRWA